MEPLGLAIGIAGLAGLFSTCIDVVESYKEYGFESRNIIARFDADKLLLQRWADDVGITDNKLRDTHHPKLDDPAVASVVGQVLLNIREIFSITHDASLRLRDRRTEDIECYSVNPSSFPGKDLTLIDKPKTPSRRRDKVKWALRGKAKFTPQVEMFGTLVKQLYRLIPLEKGNQDLDLGPTENLDGLSRLQRRTCLSIIWS